MSSSCTWLYDLGSLTSKRKRCSLFKLLLVKLSSPGLRLVVVALSLMSTSLQRNVSCSSFASRAYASFPTMRTETQRAGVLVRLKEQQINPFSHHHPSRPTEISKLFRPEVSRRCNRTHCNRNRTEQRTRRRHARGQAWPSALFDRDRAILLAHHWRRSASYWLRDPRRGPRHPATSKLSFSNAEKGWHTKTPFGVTDVFLLRFPCGFLYSLHR